MPQACRSGGPIPERTAWRKQVRLRRYRGKNHTTRWRCQRSRQPRLAGAGAGVRPPKEAPEQYRPRPWILLRELHVVDQFPAILSIAVITSTILPRTRLAHPRPTMTRGEWGESRAAGVTLPF